MQNGIGEDDLRECAKLLRMRHAALGGEERAAIGYLKGQIPQGDDILEVREGLDAIERIGAMEEDEIHLIEEALDRIAQKTYGRCLACGVFIPLERLRLVPHARFCVPCEAARERGGQTPGRVRG